MLKSLWLYVPMEGVGSARALARLVERDLAFRCLAGGVPVNHYGLSDFRAAHAEALDHLSTDSVSALIAERLVGLEEIAVDGTNSLPRTRFGVRAQASARSFRTEERLAKVEAAMVRRLAALKEEIDRGPQAVSRRQRAARDRAGRETLERAAYKRHDLIERVHAQCESRGLDPIGVHGLLKAKAAAL